MKKNFIATVGVAVVFALSIICYEECMDKSHANLLMQNVEALTRSENGANLSDCSGWKVYHVVGTDTRRSDSREHIADSVDHVMVYEIEYCYADGFGSLEGAKGTVLNYEIVDDYYEKCNGKHYSADL